MISFTLIHLLQYEKTVMRTKRILFELPLTVVTLICFAILTAGCGESAQPEKVTGTVDISVTYAGKPVSEGLVQMTKVGEGVYSSSPLDDAGHASIPDAEVGDYIVFITPPPAPAPHEVDPSTKRKTYSNIPDPFRSESTSTLKAEVKEGKNEFQFELK